MKNTIKTICMTLGLLAGPACAATVSFTTPGTATWTAPAGVLSATVEAWGGGGAGGGSSASAPSKGGGGAGGQYAIKVVTVVPGNTYTVVVGAGGTGSAGNGNSGGDSTFATNVVVAKGGAAGTAGAAGAAGTGGAGTTTSGIGDTVYAGGDGSDGAVSGNSCRNGGAGGGGAGSGGAGGNASGNTGGAGTAVGGGDGGGGTNSSNNGSAGSAAGGAGGGACTENSSSHTGGAGARGQVVITYIVVTAPTVTTNAASSISYTGATLNGTVTSNGASTTVTFDYGTTAAYGGTITAAQSPLSAGASGSAVSAALTGLTCNTTYHFRVSGVNSIGTTNGSDRTFTTTACARPTVTTNAASSISTTGATLNGTVSSNGASSTVTFEYGTSTSYGSTVTAAESPLASSATGASVTAVLSGLTCNTTYHFRAVATNSVGTTNGSDQTFTTSTCPMACNPPSNIPPELVGKLTCQCDSFGRASLNPSTIFGGNWIVTTSDSTGIVPYINSTTGLLRLTENTGNNAKAATVPGVFPAAGNYISVEFQQYAYHGSSTGADGIAVTLSDYSVTPVPGAYGGSLGYAQKTGIDGFAGGWVGVAMDEYGNYENDGEGRYGGIDSSLHPQSVGVRGSGSGNQKTTPNYPWLDGVTGLSPGIDNRASTTPSRGYYYQVIVDARHAGDATPQTFVEVNRDTGGGTYVPLVSSFDVFAKNPSQAAVPDNWQISFTGSTGGSNNIHEIGGLRICAQTILPPSVGTASGFNAIDEAYPRNDVNAVSGHLYTKLAGVPFTVKVAALNTLATGILSNYVISGSKTVTVNLIDDRGGTSCNASASDCSGCSKPVVATQTMTFTSSDAGFKQSGNFTVPAYSNLIVQVTDGTKTGCSVDNFAVRPSGLASVASSNASSLGTSIFKAGSDVFALTATTTTISGSSGYDGGVPKINAAGVQAVSPAAVAGTVAGSFNAATSGSASASATGSSFTYSEVGSFYLRAPDFTLAPPRIPGVYDDSWTAVDSGAKGDCVSGTSAAAYSNTKDANGKYGCYFGISADAGPFARFVPDHFDTSVVAISGVPMSCPTNLPTGVTCPSLYNGFVYSGQTFGMQVIARNAAGLTTQNYAGTLAKATTLTAWDALGSTTTQNPSGGTLSGNSVAASAFVAGVAAAATPVYTFASTATAPTNIYLRAVDTDGVSSLRAVPASSIEGGVMVVSGRIKVSNAYGSQYLPLSLRATAQYYLSTGWVNSLTDSVTKLALTYSGVTTTATVNPTSNVLSGGNLSINLAAPGSSGTVTAHVAVDAASPGNPVMQLIDGTATFGVYGGGTSYIYRRENY